MLDITLISPPQFTQYPQLPVGLVLLAAILQKEGHGVTLLDANALGLNPEEVPPRIREADVVGITAMTPTISAALEIARHIKKERPNLTTILGGAHATLLPEETLASSPDIDIIVKGEGDETVVELMQALENKSSLDDIESISYRKDEGLIHNPNRSSMVDMDSLPIPAYELLEWHRYRPHPPHGLAMPFAAVVTSRGCPYRCAYCSKPVFGSKFRAQSPERVIEELVYLKERFGVREVAFYDDSFTLDNKRVHAIADHIISKNLQIAWTCETRVNLVDKELLAHMRQAGCYAVAYGIESASPEIIEVLCKDTTLEQVEKAVRESREAGIQVIGYFMLGSPGETPETIRQTIDFARKLKVDFAQFSVTTPFPGTALYDVYMRGREESISWDNFVYAGTDNPTTPVFESDSLSREDLTYWARRAYRDFYLRPAYLWERLRKSTSIDEIKINLRGLQMLMRSMG